jgi:hypothetical protein
MGTAFVTTRDGPYLIPVLDLVRSGGGVNLGYPERIDGLAAGIVAGSRMNWEDRQAHSSAAKAGTHFAAFCGTAEAVPFQSRGLAAAGAMEFSAV